LARSVGCEGNVTAKIEVKASMITEENPAQDYSVIDSIPIHQTKVLDGAMPPILGELQD